MTHAIWQQTSLQSLSYRRMYDLSLEIVHSDMASPALRRVAGKVVRLLAPVVELPIADGKVLAKARKNFNRLTAALNESEY